MRHRPVDLELMRQALAPVVREALAPLYASQRESALQQASGTAQDHGDPNAMAQQSLLQAALEDAHARIRRLDQGYSSFSCKMWRFDPENPYGSLTCSIADCAKATESPSLAASGSARRYRQILLRWTRRLPFGGH